MVGRRCAGEALHPPKTASACLRGQPCASRSSLSVLALTMARLGPVSGTTSQIVPSAARDRSSPQGSRSSPLKGVARPALRD